MMREEAKADNKELLKAQKKAERSKRQEIVRQQAQEHLCKDTWFAEWHPVLTNALAILTAVFGLCMFFLPYAGEKTLITDVYPLMVLAIIIPPVWLLTFMLTAKAQKLFLTAGFLVYVFEAAACAAAMAYGGAFSIFSMILIIAALLTAGLILASAVNSFSKDKKSNAVTFKNFVDSYKTFGLAFRYFWVRHSKIAEFIRYFMVGNFITIIQFIVLPLLQAIFKNTGLVDIDFHFLGPIGGADKQALGVPDGMTVYDPYYIFSFTGGRVGSYVEKTINGVSGLFLGRGGLAYFLAMFITLCIAQVLTFIMQRKIVFKSSGKILSAVFWFVLATVIITLSQNALYGLYQPWLYGLVGDTAGGIVASFIQALISFWVFYPIFKIIFPKDKEVEVEKISDKKDQGENGGLD